MKLSFLFPCCIARQVEIWLRWYKRSKQSHYILGFCGLCLIALVTLLRDLLLDMGVMCSASDVSADVHFKCKNLHLEEDKSVLHHLQVKSFNLCSELCSSKSDISQRISCQSRHLSKSLVFTLSLEQPVATQLLEKGNSQYADIVVVKSIGKSFSEQVNDDFAESYWKSRKADSPLPTKEEFLSMLHSYIGLSTGSPQRDALQLLLESVDILYGREAQTLSDHRNFWKFIEDQEFLMTLVFKNTNFFPQLYGICGDLYAVEFVETLPETFLFPSHMGKDEKLLKAIGIVKYVHQLSESWPEPLHLCDVKVSHFGFTSQGDVKFVDVDSVLSERQLLDILRNTPECETDEDCSFFDCVAKCDSNASKCIPERINTNLQVVCSRVFLGEGSSPVISVHGLLEEETEEIIDALQLCKTNPGMTTQPLLQVLQKNYDIQNS